MKIIMIKIVFVGVFFLISRPSNADIFANYFTPECTYTSDAVLEKTKTESLRLSKKISLYSSNNLPVYRLLLIMDELTNTDQAVISCLSNTYYSPLEALSRQELLSVTTKAELVESYLRAGPEQLLNAIEQGMILPNENFSFFAHQKMSIIGYLLLRNNGDLELDFAKQITALGVDIVPTDLFYTGYGMLDNHDLIKWLIGQLDSSEAQFMWAEPGEFYLPFSLLSKAAICGDKEVLEMMLNQHIGNSSYALHLLLSKINDENKVSLEKDTNLAGNIQVLLNYGARVSSVTMAKTKSSLERMNIMIFNEPVGFDIDTLSKEENNFLIDIIKPTEKD
jgi:hypothetical protein